MASKDRLTAVLCVNATGTHKLNLMIIGSAVNPRCFGSWQPERDGKVLYAGNKTSWMNSKEFVRWIGYFNGEMSERKKTGWLLMDNCSTHCLPPNAEPIVWEAGDSGLKFRGFKMSNTNVVFLPPKTTSWVQPLDQGIIRAFKAIYRKIHIRWIISVLDSGEVENASKARPTMRSAIEWCHTAWEELSANTVKNCWNHANILPRVLPSGPADTVVEELKALLLEMSNAGEVEHLLSCPSERWTAAPVESDDEDSELTAAYQAREESDGEEDDVPVTCPVPPMTLREARAAGGALKLFVQENQDSVRMRPYLRVMEGLVRELEAMTVSARTVRTDMHDYFLPVRASDGVSPSTGARAD